MRYHLTLGHPIRVVFEPWEREVICGRSFYEGKSEQVIRVWGRRRLHILERLIPVANKFTVQLLRTKAWKFIPRKPEPYAAPANRKSQALSSINN